MRKRFDPVLPIKLRPTQGIFSSLLGLPSPQKRDPCECINKAQISCDHHAPTSGPRFHSRWCSRIEFGQLKLAHFWSDVLPRQGFPGSVIVVTVTVIVWDLKIINHYDCLLK
jgi:hypothetical protein